MDINRERLNDSLEADSKDGRLDVEYQKKILEVKRKVQHKLIQERSKASTHSNRSSIINPK